MSSFTSSLIVTPMPDGRNWCLCRPFSYHIGSRHSRKIIIVPVGFVTDFASVPQFLWWWLPYWGKYGKAAVLHDFLYQSHCCHLFLKGTRKEADKIFYEAMIVGGTPQRRAYLMYLAVRLFGWIGW